MLFVSILFQYFCSNSVWCIWKWFWIPVRRLLLSASSTVPRRSSTLNSAVWASKLVLLVLLLVLSAVECRWNCRGKKCAKWPSARKVTRCDISSTISIRTRIDHMVGSSTLSAFTRAPHDIAMEWISRLCSPYIWQLLVLFIILIESNAEDDHSLLLVVEPNGGIISAWYLLVFIFVVSWLAWLWAI